MEPLPWESGLAHCLYPLVSVGFSLWRCWPFRLVFKISGFYSPLSAISPQSARMWCSCHSRIIEQLLCCSAGKPSDHPEDGDSWHWPNIDSSSVVCTAMPVFAPICVFVISVNIDVDISCIFAHLGLGFPMLEFGYSKTTWEACVEVTLLTCCSNAPAHRLYLGLECSQFFCSESELLLFSRALSLNLSLHLLRFLLCYLFIGAPIFPTDYKLT